MPRAELLISDQLLIEYLHLPENTKVVGVAVDRFINPHAVRLIVEHLIYRPMPER